jgi:putative acetyltransferase
VAEDIELSGDITIRPFAEDDAAQVRALFIAVNRLLSPPHLRDAFETYIAQSLTEEVERIPEYYAEKGGGFWVAISGGDLVGMFGLERIAAGVMELRRMYVDPGVRRRGIAQRMLHFAEAECRRREAFRLDLSTSELQGPAISLYRNAGYRLVREEAATTASNKTIGGGIRRFYFEKLL